MKFMNRGSLHEGEKGLEIHAEAKSDYFIDTMNKIEKNDAPFAYEEMTGDFVVSACVKPEHKANYDAGGIFVLDHSRKWLKLELELTDLGHPSVVSVVTDEASDDCNGERIEGVDRIFLQVVRRGDYWVMHHSLDGKAWKMHRYFRLEMGKTVKVGFEAQSPIGDGSTAAFTEIFRGNKEIKNLRSGL
jgi:regulation of enolase protein 1 (concanavalin A-like superfamily)